MLLLPISYSHDVAPILAMHCSACHDWIRTYSGLMKGGNLGKPIIPSDPERSLLVHFIEGRRGEEHRMPLHAPPLSPEQIDIIRRWITEGTQEDPDTTKKYILLRPMIRFPARIRCRVPVVSYLILTLSDRGRTLHTEVAPNPSPTQWHQWEFKREPGWPRSVTVTLTIAYAQKEPAGAEFEVTSASSASLR